MKKRVLTVLLACTFAFSAFSGVAFAGSAKHAEPGVPGADNCLGQTLAYFAQAVGAHGLGNIADAVGGSVQDVKAVARMSC